MGSEDYTSYDEQDVPANHIQFVGTDHVDFESIRDEDVHLSDDKGLNHFGSNWEHFVDVKIVSSSAQGAFAVAWMLSNDVDDWQDLYVGDKDFLCVELYRNAADAGSELIILRESDAGTLYTDTSNFNPSLGTWYYLRIKKVGTAFTCKIYDTAASRDAETADEHLLDTLSLTLQNDYSFQYVFGCNSRNSGNAVTLVCDIEKLDLQEAAAGLSIPVAMRHYRNLRES